MLTPLIVLDRDGVINAERPGDYVKSPDEWVPIPSSLTAIARLNQAGWQVAVATNQGGIAKGLYSEADLAAIHAKMEADLAIVAAHVDFITYCPHYGDNVCDCRKPKPGLFRQIADHYGRADLTGVPVVGDSLRDLTAGVTLGCTPYLVLTGKGVATKQACDLPTGTRVHADLAAVVDDLLRP